MYLLYAKYEHELLTLEYHGKTREEAHLTAPRHCPGRCLMLSHRYREDIRATAINFVRQGFSHSSWCASVVQDVILTTPSLLAAVADFESRRSRYNADLGRAQGICHC